MGILDDVMEIYVNSKVLNVFDFGYDNGEFFRFTRLNSQQFSHIRYHKLVQSRTEFLITQMGWIKNFSLYSDGDLLVGDVMTISQKEPAMLKVLCSAGSDKFDFLNPVLDKALMHSVALFVDCHQVTSFAKIFTKAESFGFQLVSAECVGEPNTMIPSFVSFLFVKQM